MFNKLKQIKDLKNQAKVMQDALATEIVNAQKGNVSITMNGNMEVLSVKLPAGSENLENDLKNCINDAVKKTQMAMAKKMQTMGNMPGLSDLLK